ncbi:peptidoglycan-binding protein LysM [Patiriisocius marinistellae]|uniref:Peptidoglycan-binding protein LysM n=2 Tax=Patiriisocius marinistellae TaxID=2494560 RepID=A0A5J4G318_9FLAO|nr:peptidoglycan-binding protein LysM [Patiriisocius marinistellae]
MLATFFIMSSFSSKRTVNLSHYKIADNTYTYSVPNKAEQELFASPVIAPGFSLFLGKTYVGFKEALGFKESRGDYSTINQFGYLGKYQFAKATLSMIGIDNPTGFIKDSKLQERAFTAHTSRNKWILRRDIKRFKGKYINGVKVTESGILAAAHLAGAGNVKKYLRSGGDYNFEDAFGTTIGYYLKKFSGYDTSHVKANQKATVI